MIYDKETRMLIINGHYQYCVMSQHKFSDDYKMELTSNGFYMWRCSKNIPHRDNAPAVVGSSRVIWYNRGRVHRLDGPALIESEGASWWFQHEHLKTIHSQSDFEEYLMRMI